MKYKFYFPIIIFIYLFSVSSTCSGQESNFNSITFIQGDSLYKINKNSDSINLERNPFSIRYFCKQYNGSKEKFYSARVAVLQNPEDTICLKIGQNTKQVPYFEPGTGMAPGENGMYDTLFVTNSGHHYLTYENEKDKRALLISKNKDLLELEWKISAAFYNEKDVTFSELSLSSLYFIIFIDNNLNGVINKDELKIIKTIFKD
ncbi:MAG: hypothetical protein WCI53_11455 [Bacteroidota bacterium]|jgi:hypothetical protein